jgi:xanthine dehydrogenase accessory factor
MEDNSFVGTIGGGILEKRVLDEAETVISSLTPSLLSYKMRGQDLESMEMICGGDVDIFLEPIFPDNLNHLQIFKEIMEIIRRGGAGILATVVDPGHWNQNQIPKMFMKSNGDKIGSLLEIDEIENNIQSRMEQIIESMQAEVINYRDRDGNTLSVFLEPVISDPVVYVFGGGHVSKQIVPLADLVGFSVVVIDDRPEFSMPENFPSAKKVITCPFDNVMEKIEVDESSYLIIVTRGHQHDKEVLAQSLDTPAKYIGMIGSKRKRLIIYDKLLNEGYTQEQLDSVYSPIGMEINAETPEEIAVAIVAELIKVRAGG